MSKIIQMSWVSHNAAFSSAFSNFRRQNAFCDVTVCCKGYYFPAHRLILSAFSEYFKEILEQMPCKHPYILVQDAAGEDLKALLDFIYLGEVSVDSERMDSFLKMAQNLEVRGFTQPNNGETQSDTDCPSPPSEFCINMTELGKKIQKPGVKECYEIPEPAKKNTERNSKRKRSEEMPSFKKNGKSKLENRIEEKTGKSKPENRVEEKTVRLKPESRIKESTSPLNIVKPKQEPLDDCHTTADTEADRYESSPYFYGKPLVVIENCPAAVELSRTPLDGQVSVTIPPIENCLTFDESDDDFFDDDFPNDLDSDPIYVPPPENKKKKMCDDAKPELKSDDRRSEKPKPKSKKANMKQKAEKGESKNLSSGKWQYQQEYFKVGVKEEYSQNSDTTVPTTTVGATTPTATSSRKLSTLETLDGLKANVNDEELFEFVACEEENLQGKVEKSSSVAGESSEAGEIADEEGKKKPLKKQRGKKKSFFCQYCSYKTQISVNLLVHLRTHTGEKPYGCSMCPYKSTQKSALSTHMQRHAQKKLKCEQCEFETRHEQELLEHQKTHTDTTIYQCEYCPFVTNRFQTLQRHEIKLHLKSVTDDLNEDSSHPKKTKKKNRNPYKSRKRSLLSKKWIAYRKQKEMTSNVNACVNDGNTPSTSFSKNEDLTLKIKSVFDSPKSLSTFEGFDDEVDMEEPQNPTSDALETLSDSSSVITNSSLATSCATEVSNASSITNIPTTQNSASEIPDTPTSTCVTTNTHTSISVTTNTSTTSSKVLTNTLTTVSLVNTIPQPSVVMVVPISVAVPIKSPEFDFPMNSSPSSTQVADEEGILLPKVTDVYGRVPFSSPSTPTSIVEGIAGTLQNSDTTPSSGLPSTSVDFNMTLPSVPSNIYEESVHNTSQKVPTLTINSVSSLRKPLEEGPTLAINSSSFGKPLEDVPTPLTISSVSSLGKPLEEVPTPLTISSVSSLGKPLEEVPTLTINSVSSLGKPLEEVPTPLTISSVSSGVVFDEVPFVPCDETSQTDDNLSNSSDVIEEDPL